MATCKVNVELSVPFHGNVFIKIGSLVVALVCLGSPTFIYQPKQLNHQCTGTVPIYIVILYYGSLHLHGLTLYTNNIIIDYLCSYIHTFICLLT